MNEIPIFYKADAQNIPKVDVIMVFDYISCSHYHNRAEIRGAKILMSSRKTYLSSAVGYVKINHTNNVCTVKAKIVPEHRIKNKLYNVSCKIDVQNDVIIEASCEDCAASAGGCKHSLLLLFWLQQKSMEPSSTAVECYWNKPTLSSASTEPVRSKDIFPKAKVPNLPPKNSTILREFQEECQRRNISDSLILTFYEGTNKAPSYNIFDMMLKFLEQEPMPSCDKFVEYLDKIFSKQVIDEICKKTMNQAECKYWHCIRQGRLTASKLYEAAHCNTDGVLVEQILGGYKLPETKAIQRGRKLECMVIQTLEKKINLKIEKTGFQLINGLMGASPDGVGEDFVVEVKCPSTNKCLKTYINNNEINEKYKIQIMCQMMALKKKRGLLCVADPSFETTNKIHIVWINYSYPDIAQVIKNAQDFWKTFVYPKIYDSAKK